MNAFNVIRSWKVDKDPEIAYNPTKNVDTETAELATIVVLCFHPLWTRLKNSDAQNAILSVLIVNHT